MPPARTIIAERLEAAAPAGAPLSSLFRLSSRPTAVQRPLSGEQPAVLRQQVRHWQNAIAIQPKTSRTLQASLPRQVHQVGDGGSTRAPERQQAAITNRRPARLTMVALGRRIVHRSQREIRRRSIAKRRKSPLVGQRSRSRPGEAGQWPAAGVVIRTTLRQAI